MAGYLIMCLFSVKIPPLHDLPCPFILLVIYLLFTCGNFLYIKDVLSYV